MRPDIVARRQAEFDAAPSVYHADRLEQDAEIERTKTLQQQELHDLRQRVAVLERAVRPMIMQRGIFDTMHRRLHALEQRPGLQYRDVWSADTKYHVGDVVTYAGSMWVAKVINNAVKPGDSAGVWRLAVKRGRDGRDAPQPNGPVAR
jgi:hypothetical protein